MSILAGKCSNCSCTKPEHGGAGGPAPDLVGGPARDGRRSAALLVSWFAGVHQPRPATRSAYLVARLVFIICAGAHLAVEWHQRIINQVYTQSHSAQPLASGGGAQPTRGATWSRAPGRRVSAQIRTDPRPRLTRRREQTDTHSGAPAPQFHLRAPDGTQRVALARAIKWPAVGVPNCRIKLHSPAYAC